MVVRPLKKSPRTAGRTSTEDSSCSTCPELQAIIET